MAVAPITVIVNAAAGSGCPPGWASELEGRFAEHGAAAQVAMVEQGHELPQAADAAVQAGARVVVAAGGDGTVSAVASRLVGTGVALGVLPAGTLNHFAKDLGVPLDEQDAIAAIAQGHVLEVDAAEVNGRVFINNSSLGLYPDMVLDRERQRRRLGRGKWRALAAAAWRALQRYPVLTLRIDADGQALLRRSAFVFIGNNEYAMKGFEIGGRSTLNAGRLSLYVTQRTGRFGLLRLALRALVHRLHQARDFDTLTARSFVVDTPHREVRVATDGEVTVMKTPLLYRIHPAALRVIVPREAAA